MAEALDLCREYGQPLSWWRGMDRGDRALVMADRRNRVDAEVKAMRDAQREAAVARRRR